MSKNFAQPNGNHCSQMESRRLAANAGEPTAERGGAYRAESAPGAELPIDMKQLVHRCLGRIDLVERLLNSFESRFPEDLSQIEQCLHEEDSTQLTQLIHQLKGSAGNVSAPALHALMTRMEQAVKAKRTEDASRCLEDVHRAWDSYLKFKPSARLQPNCQETT